MMKIHRQPAWPDKPSICIKPYAKIPPNAFAAHPMMMKPEYRLPTSSGKICSGYRTLEEMILHLQREYQVASKYAMLGNIPASKAPRAIRRPIISVHFLSKPIPLVPLVIATPLRGMFAQSLLRPKGTILMVQRSVDPTCGPKPRQEVGRKHRSRRKRV